MNITGGMNLSLYEVQEAADIVAAATDDQLNMIFGSVINENLNEEIMVTVIATGFDHDEEESPPSNSSRRPGDIIANSREQYHAHSRQREPVSQAESGNYSQAQNYYSQSGSYGQSGYNSQLPAYGEPANYERGTQQQDDSLDIPSFLRTRRRR
jgi:cell division protein FtsZ